MSYTRWCPAWVLFACSTSGLGAEEGPTEPLVPIGGFDGGPPTQETGGAPTPEPTASSPSTATPESSTTPATTGACWSEPMDPSVSVADLRSGFRSSHALDDALEVMDRRWPAGSALLREMAGDPYIDVFLDGSSWSTTMDSLMTLCHEETHGWDYAHSVHPSRFSFWVQPGGRLDLRWIDGFPRSRIAPRVEGDATDLYDSLYLVGTQGTYGFAELLDETNAYVNGLGGAIAAWDGLPYRMSASDGPLAFLYFIALYLEEAEDTDPDLYEDLRDDPEVRAVLEMLWLRTHFFLQYSDPVPELGIEDRRIRALLYDHQQTWEDFLGHALDAGPCLP